MILVLVAVVAFGASPPPAVTAVHVRAIPFEIDSGWIVLFTVFDRKVETLLKTEEEAWMLYSVLLGAERIHAAD